MIQHYGRAPVTMPVTDYAVSLQTGVIDAAIMHINSMRSFGALEMVNSATIFADSGATSVLMMVAFSEATWNRLPADLQQMFLEEAPMIRDEQAQALYQIQLSNYEFFLESNPNLTIIDDAGMALWKDAVLPFIDEHLQNVYNDGHTQIRVLFDALLAKLADRQ